MLKVILLICLVGSIAKADCINNIPKSELANAMGNLPVDGTKKCWLTPVSDPCVCHDGIVWEAAVLNADGTLSNDPTKLAAYQAARTAKATADQQTKTDIITNRTALKTLVTKAQAGTLTTADQAAALKALIIAIGAGN